MTEPMRAAGPTEEELAAVLTALQVRAVRRAGAPAPGDWPTVDGSPLSAWRHRRLTALGQSPRHSPPTAP